MRKLFSLVLTLILVAALILPALADGWYCPNCGRYNGSNFCPKDGIRKPSDLDSTSVGSVSKYAAAEAWDRSGKTAETVLRVANCNAWITLREQDDVYSDELFKIPLNAKVLYLADGDNDFTKVKYNGIIGYVMSKYVQFDSSCENIAEFGVFEPKTMKVYNCKESVTLRKKASASSGEILQVPLGDRVEVCDYAQNGFYQVQYEGYCGYIMAKYLEC